MDEIPILFKVVVAIAAVIGLFVAVTIPIFRMASSKRERAEAVFVDGMRARNKTITWSTVDARLSSGDGSLILDSLSPKRRLRLWWLPRIESPVGFIIPNERENSDIFHRNDYRRFCQDFVAKIDDPDGIALLVIDLPGSPGLQRRIDELGTIKVCRWIAKDPIVTVA